MPRLESVGWLALVFAVTSAGAVEIGDNPSGGAIAHHALAARIDPAAAHLSVIDTLTILHHPEISVSVPFPFLLAQELAVEKVAGIGANIVPSEGRLRPRDFWDRPPYDELAGYRRARTLSLRPEGEGAHWPESLRVVISYAGTVYDTLRPPEAAYARGFETSSGLVDPRGAYLSSATFWIPYRPDERFTFRCALETPVDWHGVSQGGLLASEVRGGARVNVWDCPHPMEEIYFVAGPYVFREADHDGVAIMTYTYENTEEAIAQRYIDGTRRYLDLYGGRIGPYPFPKFAMIENFWQTGYGMPSFTLLGDRVIRLPWILDTSYGHEILHNWWGNGVFIDIAGGNWCEGLTVYGADYHYKEQEGPEQARDYRRTALQGYLDYVSGSEDIPLRLFRERHDFATQAIGYSKSMMVIHQVRRLMGEEPFRAAVQEFYRKHLFRRASWDDLFAVFSEHTGRDLGGWKEQWVDRTGAPSLALRDHRVVASAGGGFVVEVTVAQEQPDLYDLLVPVCAGWDDPPAESTKVVVLSNEEITASFRVPKRPDWIAVDPYYEVLRRIEAAEIPQALSRTLGADTALVIIADGLDSEMTAAYESLALDWDEGAMLGIFYEKDVDAARPPDLPIWFFGRGPMAREHLDQLDAGWENTLGKLPDEAGIILAGGPPDRPQNAWSLIDASGAEQIADLGRKVPHYGKYSYLVFDGSQNVAKGSWEVVSSPLRVSLTD